MLITSVARARPGASPVRSFPAAAESSAEPHDSLSLTGKAPSPTGWLAGLRATVAGWFAPPPVAAAAAQELTDLGYELRWVRPRLFGEPVWREADPDKAARILAHSRLRKLEARRSGYDWAPLQGLAQARTAIVLAGGAGALEHAALGAALLDLEKGGFRLHEEARHVDAGRAYTLLEAGRPVELDELTVNSPDELKFMAALERETCADPLERPDRAATLVWMKKHGLELERNLLEAYRDPGDHVLPVHYKGEPLPALDPELLDDPTRAIAMLQGEVDRRDFLEAELGGEVAKTCWARLPLDEDRNQAWALLDHLVRSEVRRPQLLFDRLWESRPANPAAAVDGFRRGRSLHAMTAALALHTNFGGSLESKALERTARKLKDPSPETAALVDKTAERVKPWRLGHKAVGHYSYYTSRTVTREIPCLETRPISLSGLTNSALTFLWDSRNDVEVEIAAPGGEWRSLKTFHPEYDVDVALVDLSEYDNETVRLRFSSSSGELGLSLVNVRGRPSDPEEAKESYAGVTGGLFRAADGVISRFFTEEENRALDHAADILHGLSHAKLVSEDEKPDGVEVRDVPLDAPWWGKALLHVGGRLAGRLRPSREVFGGKEAPALARGLTEVATAPRGIEGLRYLETLPDGMVANLLLGGDPEVMLAKMGASLPAYAGLLLDEDEMSRRVEEMKNGSPEIRISQDELMVGSFELEINDL